jgi:hypothetical protein
LYRSSKLECRRDAVTCRETLDVYVRNTGRCGFCASLATAAAAKPGKEELLTGIEGRQQPAGGKIVLRDA